MTDEEHRAIKERWQGVGPWEQAEMRVDERGGGGVVTVSDTGDLVAGVCDCGFDSPSREEAVANAKRIVAAPHDIAVLLAEVERLRTERDRLRGYSDSDPVTWAETWPGNWNAYRADTNVATVTAVHGGVAAGWLWRLRADLRDDGSNHGRAASLDEALRAAEKALGWERP